jgi:hypothetical protein
MTKPMKSVVFKRRRIDSLNPYPHSDLNSGSNVATGLAMIVSPLSG